jgi:putative ABC transport system permease protein
MRFFEYLDFAAANLREMKLRTALTAFGVTVGIGALVAMVGFGQGLQRNVAQSFEKLDLLNSITVLPRGGLTGGLDLGGGRRGGRRRPSPTAVGPALDDAAIRKFEALKGVETVFPEVRFPALVAVGEAEEFRLAQVIPARIAASKLITLAAGAPFARDDEDSVIVGRSLARSLGFADPAAAVGRTLRLSSIALDFAGFNPANLGEMLAGRKLPIAKETYEFRIVGVTDNIGFGGPTPIQSDVYLPPGPAGRIKKLPFTNIWDLFRAGDAGAGYSALNVRLSSPAYADAVKAEAADLGFTTFALIDQFAQIKTSFVFMDMALAAVGMIAIFVAALGIINTMVMSILERYNEIGVMKAVGASPSVIKKIFLVESAGIGILGGAGGLALGWAVSRGINRVVNYFLARQGIPHIEYFSYPLWLCLGAIAFAVAVSLLAGLYPARRAARVDPVVALRHE